MTCSQSQDHSSQEKRVGNLIPTQVDTLYCPSLAHFARLGKFILAEVSSSPRANWHLEPLGQKTTLLIGHVMWKQQNVIPRCALLFP